MLVALSAACLASAAQGEDVPVASGEPAAPEAPESPGNSDSAERTRLNLLGEVNSEAGEARRNENVRLTLIDNNVLKELLRRMGATATVVEEFAADRSYFGLEYGGSRSQPCTPRVPGLIPFTAN